MGLRQDSRTPSRGEVRPRRSGHPVSARDRSGSPSSLRSRRSSSRPPTRRSPRHGGAPVTTNEPWMPTPPPGNSRRVRPSSRPGSSTAGRISASSSASTRRLLRWASKGQRLLEGANTPDATSLRAQLSAWYATLLCAQGHYASAIDRAGQAVEEARTAGNLDALARAYNVLDLAGVFGDRFTRWRALAAGARDQRGARRSPAPGHHPVEPRAGGIPRRTLVRGDRSCSSELRRSLAFDRRSRRGASGARERG